MKYYELAYTQPYLMTLHPDSEMDVAFLGRPQMTRAFIEYGDTPALGRSVEAERFVIHGMRVPARADGYAPNLEDNPEIEVVQFAAHIRGLHAGERVYYRVAFPDTHGLRVESEIYDFHTAPEKGQPFTFAQMSDLQLFKPCDHTIHQLGRHKNDFILFSGDMINGAWRACDWFTVPGAWQPEKMVGMAFFDIMQRHDDGIRLLQYMPFFCCPGNHENDDLRIEGSREWAVQPERYSWKIYMQLFRTYYPEQEYDFNGKRYYSLDYADMHITSLMVVRCNPWKTWEAPGYILRGDIERGSRQADWLIDDLESSHAPFKWIIMHWHMMNRGDDTQPFLCQPRPDPADPARVIYPVDTVGEFLHPLFKKTRVSAVSYGHSHVYERYQIDGVNYIEAAYMGNKYGKPDGAVNPSGVLPVNQQHDFRSYLIVTCDGKTLTGRGYQASVEPNGYGYEGRLFDEYVIAEKH